MSRTYNKHHPTAHNPKARFPSPYLGEGDNIKRRNRKMRAYGSQGWKGYGGEVYLKKFGEVMTDCVHKRKARKFTKKQLEDELYDWL